MPPVGVSLEETCGVGRFFQQSFCLFFLSFLQYFLPGWEFVALAVLIRIVHATGNAAVITATFTFTAIEFQNAVGSIFVRGKRQSNGR